MAYALVSMQGRFERVYSDFIPQLRDVRRVPARYQRVLPLSVVKRYQCVVLGASSHILTVGIIERKNERLLAFLEMLTGAKIFPVLVEPRRMRLIIRRMEHSQRFHRRYSQAYYALQLPVQMRILLNFQEKKAGQV